MTFIEGNPESWNVNKVLKRKKDIVEILSQALQLDHFLEKTADTAGKLVISAHGSNSHREKVGISVFWMGQSEHEDNYQFFIESEPTREEAERIFLDAYGINESHPRYKDIKAFMEGALARKDLRSLYAIDKVVYDTSVGNLNNLENGALPALLGEKNRQDIPAGIKDFYDSTFETDEANGTLTKYSDNKS